MTQSDRLLVAEEVSNLLSSGDIVKAIKSFKPDSNEKEHAFEFVKSHYNFLQEIVKNDLTRKIIRTDFEIKDLVANVNSMLQQRDEYIFTLLVMNSPSHYQSIQKEYLKIQEEKNKNNNDNQ